MLTKPKTGGEILLKKKGKKYFSKLAKDGWKKRREKIKEWNQKKSSNSATRARQAA